MGRSPDQVTVAERIDEAVEVVGPALTAQMLDMLFTRIGLNAVIEMGADTRGPKFAIGTIQSEKGHVAAIVPYFSALGWELVQSAGWGSVFRKRMDEREILGHMRQDRPFQPPA